VRKRENEGLGMITRSIIMGGVIAILVFISPWLMACGRDSTPSEPLTYLEPGSNIPRLTAEGKARAKQIALDDPRVIELIEGKNYAVAQKYGESTLNTRIGIWHTSEDLRVIGAVLEIWFDKLYTIKYDWPFAQYDEDYKYLGEITMTREVSVEALMIYVDFREEKVVEIRPLNFGLD